eukprot:evm.model.scf_78.11 EVM.evm.TU.scf_78.11   scf_78:143346-144613(-)
MNSLACRASTDCGSIVMPRCKRPSCPCPHFFYIVAQGSWVLRCRCKHRHTEHDPATHACKKAQCECRGFDSPWVCNCDHSWADHHQEIVNKKVLTVASKMSESVAVEVDDGCLQVSSEVNRWELVARGQD